jgi:hypothetical protein
VPARQSSGRSCQKLVRKRQPSIEESGSGRVLLEGRGDALAQREGKERRLRKFHELNHSSPRPPHPGLLLPPEDVRVLALTCSEFILIHIGRVVKDILKGDSHAIRSAIKEVRVEELRLIIDRIKKIPGLEDFVQPKLLLKLRRDND